MLLVRSNAALTRPHERRAAPVVRVGVEQQVRFHVGQCHFQCALRLGMPSVSESFVRPVVEDIEHHFAITEPTEFGKPVKMGVVPTRMGLQECSRSAQRVVTVRNHAVIWCPGKQALFKVNK